MGVENSHRSLSVAFSGVKSTAAVAVVNVIAVWSRTSLLPLMICTVLAYKLCMHRLHASTPQIMALRVAAEAMDSPYLIIYMYHTRTFLIEGRGGIFRR